MHSRDLMTRSEALIALARLHRWVCEGETPQATDALLRLTWSTDVCLTRETYTSWEAQYYGRVTWTRPTLTLRNAPDALRVAVAWWLKQPAFVAAKVIVRKTRATKRGTYLQLMVTEQPHEYRELVYLSCNADGTETTYLPGPASTLHADLLCALAPPDLIRMGQDHLYARDLYTLGTHLLTQTGGTLYWPGVWRLPLETAAQVRAHLETLKPLLTSGSVTCDLIPISNTQDTSHESD